MRSRLDIKARLAAHIVAVVLLILVWVSVEPRPTLDSSRFAEGKSAHITLDPSLAEAKIVTSPPAGEPAAAVSVEVPAVDTAAEAPESPAPPEEPEAPAAPPADETAIPEPEPVAPPESPEPGPDEPGATPEPAEPAAGAEVLPLPSAEIMDRLDAGVAADSDPAVVLPPADTRGQPVSESPEVEAVPQPVETSVGEFTATNPVEALVPEEGAETPVPPAGQATEEAPAPEIPAETPETETQQPDESGALVVAEDAVSGPASLPLPDAIGLEVLGDGLYWIGPENNAAEKLSKLPEGARLVALSPETGGDDPSRTVILAVDDGLSEDGAELFLRSVRVEPGDCAAVTVEPGAWGAAFFKAAYLVVARGMALESALAEIGPDLEAAGERRREVEHRLSRLDFDGLKRALE